MIPIDKAHCEACGLCNKALTPCLTLPSEDDMGGTMVIGDYPSIADDAVGTVMKSSRERYLWRTAPNADVDMSRVHRAYALKCGGHEGKFSKAKLTHCASKYLAQEILRIKPRSILLLGKIPMEALGVHGTISSMRGELIDLGVTYEGETHVCKAVVTYPPAFVEFNLNRDEELLIKFASDLHKGYRAQFIEEASFTQHVPVRSMDQVKDLIRYILTTKMCSFDFETTKLDNKKNTYADDFKATLLSVSFQAGSAYTIPLFHFETPFSESQVISILKLFKKYVWSNPEIHKIGHNIKFDMHVVDRYLPGIEFKGRITDTMVADHQINENRRHTLKEVLPRYYPSTSGWELSVKDKDWGKIPLDTLEKYAAVDSDGTMRLRTILEIELLKDARVYNVFRNYSMFAIKAIFKMEQRGALIDRQAVLQYISEAEEFLEQQRMTLKGYQQVARFEAVERELAKVKSIEKMQKEIQELKTEKSINARLDKIRAIKSGAHPGDYAGVNFASTQQLMRLLYERHGFGFKKPLVKKSRKATEDEATSLTGKIALKSLEDTTGFINDLLIYRALSINLSTFLRGFIERMDKEDKLHTSFSISTTVTHRGASKNPNLQNVSKHVKIDDAKVKHVVGTVMKSFIPPPGHVLMAVDYSQLELRLIAHFANEKTMIEAYRNGEDLHKITGAKLMGLTLEEFNALPPDQQKKGRTNAKPANFGLIYGQEPPGFQEYASNNYGVQMTLDEAKENRKSFFELYPGLPQYHATYKAKAAKYGHVRNLFGLKRHLTNIRNSDEYLRAQDERYAVNSPIQGTGGMMTIFAFTLLEHRLPKTVQFVNSVHDSMLFYVPYRLVPYAASVIRETSCNLPTKFFFGNVIDRVPIEVDIEISTENWKDTYPYDERTGIVEKDKEKIPLSEYLCIPENNFFKIV